MKFERNKDWWLNKARKEGDTLIGAGRFTQFSHERSNVKPLKAESTEEIRLAFGKFVELMRRKLGFSIEQLAQRAELDSSELLIIEDDLNHIPEPRTVFKLAETFRVPQRSLMQLSGLAVSKDMKIRDAAVKFAARSQSIEKLSPEEAAALDSFVAILSQRGSNANK